MIGDGEIDVAGSVFNGNNAAYGLGILWLALGNLFVEDTTFIGNWAGYSDLGSDVNHRQLLGLIAIANGIVNDSRNTIIDNYPIDAGAFYYLPNGGKVISMHTTFVDNKGPAIIRSSEVEMMDDHFINNTASSVSLSR